MTDYVEEQQNEIEALEAIYPEIESEPKLILFVQGLIYLDVGSSTY